MPDEMQSPTIGALADALAKAQEEFEPILKTRTVKVQSEKGSYTFDYAPLEAVLEATGPALRKNGLALIQPLSGGGKEHGRVRTVLMHCSGEWIASEVGLPNTPIKAQELGSLITYLRRYAVSAMLGVTTEEDDDGNKHDGNKASFSSREPQRSKTQPSTSGRPATPKQHEFLRALMTSDVFSQQEREDTDMWLKDNPPMDKVSKSIANAQLRLSQKESAHA